MLQFNFGLFCALWLSSQWLCSKAAMSQSAAVCTIGNTIKQNKKMVSPSVSAEWHHAVSILQRGLVYKFFFMQVLHILQPLSTWPHGFTKTNYCTHTCQVVRNLGLVNSISFVKEQTWKITQYKNCNNTHSIVSLHDSASRSWSWFLTQFSIPLGLFCDPCKNVAEERDLDKSCIYEDSSEKGKRERLLSSLFHRWKSSRMYCL